MRAHTIIYCINPDTMTHFYKAVMEMQQSHHRHRVVSDVWQLEFVQIPQEVASTITLSTPPSPREETPIKLSFEVDDIALVRELADLHGGLISSSTHEWHYEGHAFCNGFDPEGNVFQVFARLPEPA